MRTKRAHLSEDAIAEFKEQRLMVAQKAIGLLDELLDLLKDAKDTIVSSAKVDRSTLKDITLMTSKLVDVIKLVGREDLSDLEPTIEHILEEARREFADVQGN